MQMWEYATVIATPSSDDRNRNFYVGYCRVDGFQTEQPKRVRKDNKEVLPDNSECWNWFYRKISELGRGGWEMVSANNTELLVWELWFKRPL